MPIFNSMVRSLMVFGVAGFSSVASAATVGYWNFNSYSGGTSSIASNIGSASLLFSDIHGISALPGMGTTVNREGSTNAGRSLTVVGQSNNGGWIDLSFSMTGLKNLQLSYAEADGIGGLGFDQNSWSYSTNGTSFTNFASNLNPAGTDSFSRRALDFSSVLGLNDQSNVTLRFMLGGAQTHLLSYISLDNVRLDAAPVPLPAAAVLLVSGLLGLGAVGRRRKVLAA